MGLPDTFTAFQYHQTADGIQGRVVELPMSGVGDGDCLIRVTHSSVNYKDGLAATGRAATVQSFPLVGGADAVGVIVEGGTSGLVKAADHVVVTGCTSTEPHNRGYAEYLRVPAEWVTVIPDSLTLEDAATYGTAARAVIRLEEAGARPKDGPVAVQPVPAASPSRCSPVSATRSTRSPASHRHARSCSPTARPRCSPARTWRSPANRFRTTRGAGDIDPVGGDTLAWLIRTTRPHGCIVTFGHAGGRELHTNVLPFMYRANSLLGTNITWPSLDLRNTIWNRLATDLRPAHLDDFRRTISADELPHALEQIVTTGFVGRTIVEISDPAAAVN